MMKNQDLVLLSFVLVAGLFLHGCDKEAIMGGLSGIKVQGCSKACAASTGTTPEKCDQFCKCAIIEKKCTLANETATFRKECLESCEQQVDIKSELAFEDLEGKLASGVGIQDLMGGSLSQKVDLPPVSQPVAVAAFSTVLIAVTAGIFGVKAYLSSGNRRGVAVEEPLNDVEGENTDAEEPVVE